MAKTTPSDNTNNATETTTSSEETPVYQEMSNGSNGNGGTPAWAQPGPGPTSGLIFTAGTFVITGIYSNINNGFIVAPLVWRNQSEYSGPYASTFSMLEDGEIGLWCVRTTDNRALYDFTSIGGDGIFQTWFAASPSNRDTAAVGVSYDTAMTPSPGNATYQAPEQEQLRDLFGQPTGATITSQIKAGIKKVATTISTMDLDVRFKSEAVKTKAFADDELTLLTDEETGQGVSLALTTTKTQVSETETQVESMSTFTTGGGY